MHGYNIYFKNFPPLNYCSAVLNYRLIEYRKKKIRDITGIRKIVNIIHKTITYISFEKKMPMSKISLLLIFLFGSSIYIQVSFT